MTGPGDVEEVVERGKAAFQFEDAHVRVAHDLVPVDEPGDRGFDVARLGGTERFLVRFLPVDDREREFVLGAELPDHGLPGYAGRPGDGLDRHLVIRVLQPLVVGRAQDALTGRRDRLLPGLHAIGPRHDDGPRLSNFMVLTVP